jgi:hypothetical protein
LLKLPYALAGQRLAPVMVLLHYVTIYGYVLLLVLAGLLFIHGDAGVAQVFARYHLLEMEFHVRDSTNS